MLREIIGKRLQVKPNRVLTMRGYQLHRKKTFLVSLSCRHQVTVPFGRRPKVGKKMTCPECANVCAICEEAEGTVTAQWDDREVKVCAECFKFETGEDRKTDQRDVAPNQARKN